MVTELRSVDPAVWKACSGFFVQIPSVHSLVYYFPQGHAEQSSSPPPFSAVAASKHSVLCRILSVDLLANTDTDEVFAKISLQPIPDGPFPAPPEPNAGEDGGGGGGDGESSVVSFAKVLTPSDANNGGGFSVPRFCADSIFPPLNYQADPPVQTLSVTDVHGAVWDFRHIYRGTPRRHLLTTGWSKFVNSKKLIAGDSVVFMRNRRSGKLFVGVRRVIRSSAPIDAAKWMGMMEVDNAAAPREGFTRSGKGRVSPESVVAAAELAAQGLPFEIVYYPKAGAADFVVRAELVDASLELYWTAGMRVKMAMETEDSSRMTWFQGTLAAAAPPEDGPWQASPWRMLQVAWDEPEVLQHVKRVSPWQVEYVSPTPSLDAGFPPSKRFKVSQGAEMLNDRGRDLVFPMTGLTNSAMGQFNPSFLSYNPFPAGMQGARQNSLCVSGLPNLLSEDTPQMSQDNFFGIASPQVKFVSTELNIGSSLSGNLSPDSQSSVHFSTLEHVGNHRCNSSPKVCNRSIQLFGKIIHMAQPDESGLTDDGGRSEDDSSQTEGLIDQISLTYPYMNLLDRLDVQSSSSNVDACSL